MSESQEITRQQGVPWQPPTVRELTGPHLDVDQEPEFRIMEYVNLIWIRKWVLVWVFLATVTLGLARALTQPKLYRSVARIALLPSPQLSKTDVDSMMNFWQMDRYIADQVQVFQTRQLAQRVVDRLGLESQPGFGSDAATSLLNRIEIEPLEGTDVLEIWMVGKDPGQVAEWLNLYVKEFIAANIEDGLERTRQIYEVIQSRLNPIRDQLAESEQQLMQFREREDALLFADQDKNVISEQVNTLTTEYAQAKADRIRLETKINALRQLRASNLSETGFPEVLADTTIQALRQQRNELGMELADKLRTFKEGHPTIKELRSRVAGVDGRLRQEIENVLTALQTDYDIARRRETSLFDNIQQLKEQSIELSKQTMEYERLKREYDQNKAFLEDMLARSKEADISSSASLNNVRIIEPALPARTHFSPSLQKSLAISGALGLLLGIGLVLGLDYLDQTLRTPEAVERYLGLEVLSVLPKLTEDNARVLRESFQSLRTAVMLAARGEGCHMLMVTSAVPAEGKTTVVFNLGKVLASAGSRVLLIDADLRKPRLHRIISAKNVRGLTSVVLGERELHEVITAVADVPNLDVVSSGPLPPNPPELYGKASFSRLLAKAREDYDWIIIDTPPVASVTDPVICSSLVDMVLVVIQYGHARKQLIRDALRGLSRTGVRVAGCLLNKVDVDRDHYYYSYYYSSYYRYGYGEDEQSDKRINTSSARAG